MYYGPQMLVQVNEVSALQNVRKGMFYWMEHDSCSRRQIWNSPAILQCKVRA